VAAISAAAIAMVASAAQAQSATNASLASPGVYFGGGNANGAFATDTADGIEIGLRAKISGIHPQITPAGDVYAIPLGDTFGLDYSFNPSVTGTEADFSTFTQSIKITDAFGLSVSFDPSKIGDNTVFGNVGAPNTSPNAPLGGFQNSEKISFGFLDPGYNPNKDDTFDVTYTVTGANGAPVLSVQNVVNVGAGAVPEPAAWALMLLGFGGVGASLRRRRTMALAA
jgi:hypothetical protein